MLYLSYKSIQKEAMSKRIFSELPVDYQAGCHLIEKQCYKLLTTSKIKFGAVYWDDLDLVACHLYVRIADKTYHAKFGKISLTQAKDSSIMRSIIFRLKLMINQIKQESNEFKEGEQ